MLEKACIDVSSEACFSVKMICIASNVAEADRAIGQFQTQSFREKSLLLLLDFNAGVETILNKAGTEFGNVTIFHLNSALTLDYKMAELVDTTHVAFMNTDNHYGEHFLTDLAHAAIYTDANVIGKAAFFRLAGDELKIVDGEEYRFTNLIFSTSSIMDSSLIGEHRLQDVTELFRGDKTVEHFFGDTAKCFSTNRFNFIESAYSEKISDMKKHRLLADA